MRLDCSQRDARLGIWAEVWGRIARSLTHHGLRGIARHVHGNREQSDSEKNDQAGLLQLVAFAEESEQEQAHADHETHRRKVVEQKVYVGEIHKVSGRTSLTYLAAHGEGLHLEPS